MPQQLISRVKPRQPDPFNSHISNPSFKIKQAILILLLFATISQCFNIKELDVSADTYIIGAIAKYTIVYDRTQQNFGIFNDINANPVPASATLTLTVPSVYTFDYTITLSALVNGGAPVFPNYTIASNIITVNNLFASTPIVSTVTIIIQNMRNPSPAIVTDAFEGYIGIDYAEPIFLSSVVVLQPAQFQSCYMTFNPKFVNRTAAMVFTIVPKTPIPVDGGLLISFPSNVWSEGTTTSTTNFLPISTSMSCGNLSPNIKSTIQCRGTQNQNRISVTNVFSANLNSGEQFSFSVNNFLSPPSNRPSDLIRITSEDSLGNKIDVCSEYVTDLIPNQMSSSKITITNGGLPLTVNLQYTIRFMFETVDSFALSDYFEIQFPSGSNFVFNPNVLSGGITLVRTNATYSSNILRCYMNPLLSVKNYSAPFTMFISAGTYAAPPSIEPTGNFKISIMRNGFPLQVGFQSLTPVATTLSGFLTARGSQVVNRMTSFTFSITINDALSSTGKIRIRLPPQVQIGSDTTSCASLTGTNMIETPLCVINLPLRTIELININSSPALIPAQTFTVLINNLVNPFSTAITSTFQVRSFYRSTDASLVAVGSITGFVSKEATIDASNVLIQSSSSKVLESGATYTVRLDVENQIDIGGSVNLFIPKPITLNSAVLTSSCRRAVNTATTTTTPCTLVSEDGTGYLVRFSNPFAVTGVAKGQYIILEINGIITNPPSTSPVSSFKLYTFAASSSIIAKIQSSLSIQVTDPASLSIATYSRDSPKNYDLTSYHFTIKQVSVMEINSVIIIQFPPEILPNVSMTCGMTAPFNNANLVCGLVNASAVRVTLPASLPIASQNPLTLTVSNVRNPISFKPPGDFFIRTFTSGQAFRYAQGKTSNILSNTIESIFTRVEGSYTPGQLDTATTLTISFQPAFQAPGSIQVSIPQYFVVGGSLTCSQVANFNGVCTSVSSHTIRVQGTFTSNGLTTFQISGFTSTIRAPTSTEYVLVASFTADNFALDYSNDKITYVLDCPLPCKTCDTVDRSLCKSCYSNSAITDKLIFDSNTASCYSKCPDGKFENQATLLCEDCSLNCLTCERSSTFCTSCKQTSAFKFLHIKSVDEQICVSQCEQKMYPDTTKTPPTCVNCVTPCETCESLDFCLTCLDTFYFWKNTCTKSCPLGQTVGDDTTGNCELCSTNCLTCATTVNTCTSCTAPLILYNSQCISECVLPLVYRPEILTCGPCDTQCRTCQETASKCTSCDPVSLFRYFFDNDCLKQCPDRYYQTVSSCALCSQLNRNCDFCINSTYCEKCNLDFVAFGGDCLATTPNGFVNISGIAESCQEDCATCQITRTNCTSCKTLNLLGNTCQTNCPATTIALNKRCAACQSPCRTCAQNVNNCTSCIATMVPTLYLIENRCEIECPQFFYPDSGTNRCLECQNPCHKCTSLTRCITCANNYFLYQGTSCISNCPLHFIGINKICEQCRSPCRACVDSTTKCLSCEQDYFFFNSTNKCVTDCGEGLFEEFLNRTCISCTAPCKTCTNTTNTCLSCLTGILYNFQCIRQCPMKMYNDTGVCENCPAECAGCTSKVMCTNCTSSYVLHNNFCITKCPDTHAVIFSGACTKCSSTNCHKCFDNDVCYNCVSDFSLLNGACLSVCPAGFETNGTHCEEVLASTLESSNSNMFPVPLSIASSVVLVACMMSKLQNQRTFLAGAIYSLLGIIETLALLYYIYLYYMSLYMDYPIGIYIALGSLGLLYFLNILSILQSIVLCYDKKHSQWKDSSAMNKFYNTFSTLIGIFISHKFKNLMFSRLFAFVLFSAPLDDVKKFKIFNIFSFISLISSGGAIFSVITIIKLVDPQTQLFHACLDLLIVTGINILIAFFNTFKGEDFFKQITPEGLMLNRVILGDQDSYNAKISVDGNDIEVEQGQGYYSKIQHTLGSHQPFKFKESDQSRQDLNYQYDLDSLTNIEEKQFESVSVQAYDMLNEKQQGQTRIDFSTLKVNQNDSRDNSKFTTIFQNEDKSIQNTIDYGRKKVDYSIQKYDDVSLVDRSIQGNQGLSNNDISIQYSKKNNHNDVSIQGSLGRANHNDISVQNSARYADQSGQYSFLQSEKGVQNMVMLNDRSIQQSVNNQSWGGQNTLDVKDISVQKESEQIEYNQFDQTLDQNDETLKNVDNIFYIDEDEQEEDFVEQGLPKVPQSGKKLLNSHLDKRKRKAESKQLQNDNKKTITRQQLPEEKEEDFDFPPEQIKSYEEELEQKIVTKQKELDRVRKEIEQKEKESELKERLMREENERVQKELKQTQLSKSINEQKNQQQTQKLKQQLKLKEQQLKKEQAIKQQLLQDKQGSNKELQDKSTMMRMVQQVDDATSIDHINLPHGPAQISFNQPDTQDEKQQTLGALKYALEAPSKDDELQLKGLQRPNKKNNFQVDMDMYIREKSEYEVNEESKADDEAQSIKTKAKPSNRRKSTINQGNRVNEYDKNRQVEVRSSKQPSPPLNLQNRQNMNSINQEHIGKHEKQPGRIRESARKPQINPVDFEQTQNYIYQVEDMSLQQEQSSISMEKNHYKNNSHDETNKDPKIPQTHSPQRQTPQNNFQEQIDNLPATSNISQPLQHKSTPQPKLILDETDADKQLNDQPNDQFLFQQNNQPLDELYDQYFDSSQDISPGLPHKQPIQQTQSDVEEYVHKKTHLLNQQLLKEQQQLHQNSPQNLTDHQELKRAFNDSRKKLPHSNSLNKKPIPPENKETLHVNISKLNSYQTDKPINQRSNNSISPKKSSLLANAAHNLVATSNDSADPTYGIGNDMLMKKSSSNKNPLVTQKKWENENAKNLNSIEQSSEGNDDSQLYQPKNNTKNHSSNIPKSLSKRQPPPVPLQTDKQETSFSHQGIKIGGNNLSNQPSTKSINQPERRKTSIQKLSARELLGQNNYGEQVQVHFQTKQDEQAMGNKMKRNLVEDSHTPNQPLVGNQVRRPNINNGNSNNRPLSTSKQQSYIHKPPGKPATVMKQYESQEIFGDEYQQSEEDYSQANSFDQKISKNHRNNLIMDKMMERPDNDDLYDYYNRASTKKGSNNKRNSKQPRSNNKNYPHNTKINLSKEKLQNDRKMEKIYMQRLDSKNKNRY